MTTEVQRDLADYCQYLPDGSRQPCLMRSIVSQLPPSIV
jgi:hypothetical protein